ncbi:hypothetical protein K493DRAFT_4673 [Basidiobolus meristosporus CBS 931.73]|uniref:Cyclin N-terminal domain-containing protein n=1 Tax=Basidiobolus meristosporus CBS 931.73 TaxID=1314790 RepID=A0A1Y1VR34_9FUNG|nr:hypothetical protein K493DRAFT_309693 [Basidiobolus meristosporus CBS 931.73]ORX71055.1 hypothetical protein K493DRAFT_4673 [Basidiobolus meristosporus CBS 931.73]|eukprot:ORX63761.1 hypothetical protein K493DRAFT_309693 [Basidiobolus meristosporus CBS 931.73]
MDALGSLPNSLFDHLVDDLSFCKLWPNTIKVANNPDDTMDYTEMVDVVADLCYSIWHMNDVPFTCFAPLCFKQFCQFLLHRTQLSWSVIIIGLMYLHRYRQGYPEESDLFDECQLVTVAFMLAMKFHEDVAYNNRSWSTASGISVEELNQLEMRFLSSNFDLFLNCEQYQTWLLFLEEFTSHVEKIRAQSWCFPTNTQLPNLLEELPLTPLDFENQASCWDESISNWDLELSDYF